MATYQCDLCGQTTADFMVTFIADGSVQAIGIECFEAWALPIVEAYNEHMAREADDQADADDAARTSDPDADQAGDEGSGEAALPPAEGADAEWEAEYPQGPKKGGRRRREGAAATVGEGPEASPPTDGEG